MIESLSKSTISYEDTAAAAEDYIPFVNQVLWTCKLQPDTARLDERLQFEWKSGIEASRTATSFLSEALMYELVMSVACQALATGGAGCDLSVAGDFASAGKQFKTAAAIWKYLGQDLLPKWIARGSDALEKDLPAEANTGIADAMTALNLAYSQQMVVSAALAKSTSKPSYSLMAKLTLGIAEQIDEAVKNFNKKAPEQVTRMDSICFSLLKFQLEYQRFLSKYYLARAAWDDNHEYGIAVAMMQEVANYLHTLPDVETAKSPLRVLGKDLAVVRAHITSILQAWEKDNSTVYFESVPQQIPITKRLQAGMKMVKEPQPYIVQDPAVLPLSIPPERPPATAPTSTNLQRSDSDLARELQARFNAGLHD